MMIITSISAGRINHIAAVGYLLQNAGLGFGVNCLDILVWKLTWAMHRHVSCQANVYSFKFNITFAYYIVGCVCNVQSYICITCKHLLTRTYAILTLQTTWVQLSLPRKLEYMLSSV